MSKETENRMYVDFTVTYIKNNRSVSEVFRGTLYNLSEKLKELRLSKLEVISLSGVKL